MQLQSDFREFVESLNGAGVRYVLVGGYAVAFHGHPRHTDDIDFLVDATPENATRVCDALGRFGLASLGLTPANFVKPDIVVQLGRPPHRIDLLTGLEGVRFAAVWKSRVEARVGGLRVPVIGRSQLVRNKRAVGRPEDLLDVRKLIARPPRRSRPLRR